MKSINRLFVLVVIAFALPLACGTDSDNAVNPDNPSAGEFVTEAIQVDLPSGVNLDLTTTELSSLFDDYEVSANGATSATFLKTGRSLATLLDSTGQIILAGFVSDSKRELSVASSVEAALYFAMGTVLLPEEIKELFMAEASTLPGFGELVTQAESLFRVDPNFLTGADFFDLLQAYITLLTQPGEITDIGLARLTYTSDTRSGIRLEEQAGDAIILVNKYRRRAHAFFYKTRSKDLNGVPTIHVTDIAGSNASFQHEVIVGPVSGVSGFLGTLQSAAAGKGLEFARKDSDPTTLKLLANESEATFKVRAIGPSPKNDNLTIAEQERLKKLYIETLGYDFALPILLATVGGDEFLKDFKASKWEPFLVAFTETVGALSNVSDPLYQGDLKKATTEFIIALSNSTNAGIFEDLYQAVLNNIAGLIGGFSQENHQKILSRSASFFKVLAIIDEGLQAADFLRIYDGVFSSNTLEEWEVNVSLNKVSLDPKETLVIQGEEKIFKTTIHDSNLAEGESYEYRYSINQSYGELRSKSTRATGDSIVSSNNQVGYFSSNTIDLPESAVDTITVEVYINHGTSAPLTRVGEAKAAIEIKTFGFIVEPDDMTIDGGTQLKLYVKRADGSNPVENSSFDYRFAWNTSGNYGLFNGAQSDISVVNDNSVIYEALDKETAQGTEEVEVGIYARKKGTTERYRFIDRVEATIHIENDPLKESFFLDFVTVGVAPWINEIYCEWSVQNACYFSPFVPPAGLEVVSYQLTITEGWPAIIGTGQTWLANNTQNDIEDSVEIHYGEPENDDSIIEEGVYVYRIGGTGAQGGASYCDGTASSDYADKIALYKTFKGKAQVVITLRYKD